MKHHKTLLPFIILFILSCSKSNLDEIIVTPPIPVLKLPVLITDSASNLTIYSVKLSGKVIDTGESQLIEHGIIVGTNPELTVTENLNKFSANADSSGHFNTTIIEVPANTSYYFRAYGINKQGVGYGAVIKFNTPQENILHEWRTVLTTQKEVDEFGAKGYTTIINALEINGSNINDLRALKTIVKIGGGLNILNTSLINLKGLESLEAFGYQFFNSSNIDNNPLLKDLTGLDNLKKISGPIQLAFNSSLVNLVGLKSLKILHGSRLGIYECNKLENLNGLENLVFLDGEVFLERNPLLSDLKGLRNVESITSELRIAGNNSLTNIDGLEKIKYLSGLTIRNNKLLKNLNGLKNLETLGGVILETNPELNDLSAFHKVKSMESVQIFDCAISNLNGFSNLESVDVVFEIERNESLIDLQGVEKLQKAGQISIAFNNSLKSLKGLDALNVAKRINVFSNSDLIDLKGLENLRTVEYGIDITNNSPFLNYCALKPYLLRNSGESFQLKVTDALISKVEVLATCP